MRAEPQLGQREGIGQARPQWWHRSVPPAWWYTSGRVQSGQIATWPQSRHSTTEAVPRRLITRIACSPALRFASADASERESIATLPAASSARRSTISTDGGAPL